MTKRFFNRYHDIGGEGDLRGEWLRITHVDVVQAGIEEIIGDPGTRMSPPMGQAEEGSVATGWVYLAGEDISRFIQALKAQGVTVAFEEQRPVRYSSIRRMAPYRMEYLLFSPVKGRLVRKNGVLLRISNVSTRGRGRVFFEEISG